MSNIIKNYLNAQYKYRLDTDVLFEKGITIIVPPFLKKMG